MQNDGKAWLFAPSGLADGPLPTHYEPDESPVPNLLYRQQANPGREVIEAAWNRSNPPASDVYPYAFTTYRLTEHHTAGGMSRTLPYLSELQPEFFVEVSPQLAEERGLENGGWATLVSARTAIEAKVLVTERIRPLKVGGGKVVHQIGVPYHWGEQGISTGDSGNDLFGVVMDPNVHIQESKVATCDIQPGRRPRGPALVDFVESYRERAGVKSGRVPVGGRSPVEATNMTGERKGQATTTQSRPGPHRGGHLVTQISSASPAFTGNDPENRLFGPLPDVTGGGRLRARPPGAGRVLHRHQRVHRLQGLRGGLQGVEHAPDGRRRRHDRRPGPVRDELRQHRHAGRELVAARGVRRAVPRGRPADARDRAAGRAGPGCRVRRWLRRVVRVGGVGVARERRRRDHRPGQRAQRAGAGAASTRRPRSPATGRSAG